MSRYLEKSKTAYRSRSNVSGSVSGPLQAEGTEFLPPGCRQAGC